MSSAIYRPRPGSVKKQRPEFFPSDYSMSGSFRKIEEGAVRRPNAHWSAIAPDVQRGHGVAIFIDFRWLPEICRTLLREGILIESL